MNTPNNLQNIYPHPTIPCPPIRWPYNPFDNYNPYPLHDWIIDRIDQLDRDITRITKERDYWRRIDIERRTSPYRFIFPSPIFKYSHPATTCEIFQENICVEDVLKKIK